MNRDLYRKFVPFVQQSCAADFTPEDTIPWSVLDVEVLLEHDYRRGRQPIESGTGEERLAAVAGWADSSLRPGCRIVDLGCGAGPHSLRLAARGFDVTGLDISQPFLTYAREQAERRGLSCTFACASIHALPFREAFDAALITQGPSLQLPPPRVAPFLREVRKALRTGAQLLCEFSVLPPSFDRAEPTKAEVLSENSRTLLGRPLRAQLSRRLTFPSEGQRVNHYLFLFDNGDIAHWWARFHLHPIPALQSALDESGFTLRQIHGTLPGQPLRDDDLTSFFWAEAR